MRFNWTPFSKPEKDQVIDRLGWLNLEIMQAKVKKNWRRLRDLVAERKQVEECLERGDRRATTIVSA